MATALRTADPQSAPVLLGWPTETNDRVAEISVRPGRTEGDFLGLMLRKWGNGHWCVANGQPHFYTYRIDAERAAQRWIEEGRG